MINWKSLSNYNAEILGMHQASVLNGLSKAPNFSTNSAALIVFLFSRYYIKIILCAFQNTEAITSSSLCCIFPPFDFPPNTHEGYVARVPSISLKCQRFQSTSFNGPRISFCGVFWFDEILWRCNNFWKVHFSYLFNAYVDIS